MNKRKKEALGTGIFIIMVLLGDMFEGTLFKWAWVIGIVALFLFFAIVPGYDKPLERD